MIKKVVIAAAGKGTRMLQLSQDRPKHLIEVKEKPFLCYLFNNLLRAGYQELILVAGYKYPLMEKFLSDYKKRYGALFSSGTKIDVLNQFDFLEKDDYGTLCPIKCISNIIRENFLVVYGDNLYSSRDLKSFNIDDDYNYVGGLCVDNPQEYGVFVKRGDFLEEIIEKPKEFKGNLINTGLYKFTPEIFQKISEVELSPRGEYELTDAINLLAQEKKVKVKELKDYWLDFGKPEDIKKVSDFLEKEKKTP
jgi:dTDP-glucose pyrophosphorylase